MDEPLTTACTLGGDHADDSVTPLLWLIRPLEAFLSRAPHLPSRKHRCFWGPMQRTLQAKTEHTAG